MQQTLILAFYKFHPIAIETLEAKQIELEKRGEELGIKGLAIIGVEGLNATLCGPAETLRKFVNEACESLGLPTDVKPKESWAAMPPFRRMKVKVREEIVTLGKPEVLPLAPNSEFHLSPDNWDKMMNEEDVTVIDTRNWYETKIGKFKGALDPNIEEFIEFSDYLKKTEIPKDKKVLIYCTGGIRCEKAIVEMHQQGFENVYQLDGGILNYLEQRPNKNFEGECFVFDHRVAIDQNLQPSQTYKLCPHCGQPGKTQLQCRKCESDAVVCDVCVQTEHLQTCSKNCAHHYQRNRETKGRQQNQGYRFEVPKQVSKLSMIILALVFFGFSSISGAAQGSLGLGAIIGGPTALSAKYWLAKDKAIDAGLSFDLSDYVLIFGDYLVHFPGLFKTQSPFINSLNCYVGVGPVLAISTSNPHDNGEYFKKHTDSLALGVRVPFGVEWMAKQIPLGVSLELAPGLVVIPATTGFIQGGIAARYYL